MDLRESQTMRGQMMCAQGQNQRLHKNPETHQLEGKTQLVFTDSWNSLPEIFKTIRIFNIQMGNNILSMDANCKSKSVALNNN